MRILCNLFPLGTHPHGTGGRTGIYRVVEHLAYGLAVAPECETVFHAAADSLWEPWRYYVEHLAGPRTHFATTPWRVIASRHLSPLQRINTATIQNRSLPMRATRFAFTRYAAAAARWLDRIDGQALEQAEVYHSPVLPIPTVVKRRSRIRRFTTIYDLIPLSHPQFCDAGAIQLVRRVADSLGEEDHALCISEATRTALLERVPRLDPARVFVTPLAAGAAFHPETDPEKIAACRVRLGLPTGAPYFLSVCTLEPRKNLDSVIRAFVRLKQAGQIDPATCLVLVGNVGWKTAKIFSALEEAGAARGSILLPGFVPDDELAALYSGALAFIFMSWLEGFGLPPLEAMQCGVPVICSKTSSLPEVVGDAGILLAPDDLDGIADAMGSLARDENRRQDLSARALERARLFSWERFIQQNLAAYRTALATR